MNAGTVTPECTELLSRITKRNLRQEELTPPVIFLAAFVVVGMGVVYADNRAKEEETQLLQEMLNQFAPPDSEMQPWVQQLTDGIQTWKIYKSLHNLQILTYSLSEPEKLYLLGLGYKLSATKFNLSIAKIQYLRQIAIAIKIDSQKLAILEAGINLGVVKDEITLNQVYDSLDSVTLTAINKIQISLPPRLSENNVGKLSEDSTEMIIAATCLNNRLKNCFDELSKFEIALKIKREIINCDGQTMWTHIGNFAGYRTRLSNFASLVSEQKIHEYIDRDFEMWIKNSKKRIYENAFDGIEIGDKTTLPTKLMIQNFNHELNLEIEIIAVNCARKYLIEVFDILENIKKHISIFHENINSNDFANFIVNQIQSEIKFENLAEIKIENLAESDFTTQEWAEIKFMKWRDDLTTGILKFRDSAVSKKSAIAEIKQKILEKGWKKFEQSKNQFSEQLKTLVVSIVNQKIEAAIAITENAISLYEQLLEYRERYCQEKPEQLQKETAWVVRQQQRLEQVQQDIDAILKS